MTSFENKKVLVVGLARSGLAAARYLAGRGARVTVTDTKAREELAGELKALSGLDIEYHLGSNPVDAFVKSGLVVLSPGVPTEICGVKEAVKKGIPVVCELELGLKELSGKVIAVTGTNGKSTTTALVGELLKAGGKDVWVGGNIGNPLTGGLDVASRASYVVLELSSYQLELTPSLKPYIAIWLNMTPDHLDRYRSFGDYVKAKTLVGARQDEGDFVIYNADDRIVLREVESFRSRKLPFSLSGRIEGGAWYKDSELIISGNGEAAFSSDSVDTKVSPLKGVHNRENMAAAVFAAAVCGVSGREMKKGLKEFKGLPHRLQFVRDVNGVGFYNDSKGTNVGAVKRSLESFDRNVILIAGGLDKNTGYDDLRNIVAEKVRFIAAIGEAAQRIRCELGDVAEVTICGSMRDAVALAASKAAIGDTVLLSPACASFDMYKDYAERGRDFERCVNELKPLKKSFLRKQESRVA